ncbi:MAG TPA: DUF2141 domain-containing protein [Caulobacteraceae bacterium]
MMTWKSAGTILVGVLASAPIAAFAQDCEGRPSSARLSVVVEGVASNKGLIAATLYGNAKARFLVRNGALKVWRAAARSPTTSMCIWLGGPGTYAVAVYHDANANMKFDIGPLGPTEAYGFSNNPRITFSKPSLEAVRFFARAGDNTVRIRLRHP